MMIKIDVAHAIFVGLLSCWLVYLINHYQIGERLKRLFNKQDNNKLPLDYDCVNKVLDEQVKKLATKYNIKLTFEIKDELINSDFHECQVLFCGDNCNHGISFSFFGRIKNIHKKTSAAALTNLVLSLLSEVEDKLFKFLILDKLISLNNKIDERPKLQEPPIK